MFQNLKIRNGILTGLLVMICTITYSQNAVFLHHSTGLGVYRDGDVSGWIANYNSNNGTNYQVIERSFPYTPYEWVNYPYDYWNLWVNNACNNNEGGIIGGISSGMPIIGRVFFKPTPTIRKSQMSIDINKNKRILKYPPNTRSDICIAIRAVKVVEAMIALSLVDSYLLNKTTRFEEKKIIEDEKIKSNT